MLGVQASVDTDDIREEMLTGYCPITTEAHTESG